MSDEEVMILEDELEEGEITNDSDSNSGAQIFLSNFNKVIPKRYSLPNKTTSHEKHKKNCKRSCSTRKDRDKSSFPYNSSKKQKSASSSKHSDFFHNSSPSAFKKLPSPPLVIKNSYNTLHDSVEDNYPDLLLDYKKCREQLKRKKQTDFVNRSKSSSTSKLIKHSLELSSFPGRNKRNSTNKNVSPVRKSKSPTNKNKSPKEIIDITDKSPSISEEAQDTNSQESSYTLVEDTDSSEDEEELRKLALATCAKRNLQEKIVGVGANISPAHSLSNQSSVEILEITNYDNHEVVDMELSDENDVEEINNGLFRINNMPPMLTQFHHSMFTDNLYVNNINLSTFDPILTQNLSESFHYHNQSEDFISHQEHTYPSFSTRTNGGIEQAILRAENIASMYQRKPAKEMSPEPEKSPDNLSQEVDRNKIPVLCNGTLHKPVEEMPVEKNAQVSDSQPSIPAQTLPSTTKNVVLTQNRLIITLNNDSSSEEESDGTDDNQEEASSFDALIASARQQSDMKANEAHMQQVSCLSKTQQEEYKKLKTLLAEKEPITVIPQPVKEKVTSEDQSLNFLTKKILTAKEKLDKDVKGLLNAEKEVVEKKKNYLSSKLKFQHLQEQLHAAKMNKLSKLKEWKVNEAKLVNVKNVVTQQKKLVDLLETELNSRRLQFDQNSHLTS